MSTLYLPSTLHMREGKEKMSEKLENEKKKNFKGACGVSVCV